MAYFQGTFEERCLTAGAPLSLAFFTMSLSVLFLITSIPGNILVVLAVFRDPYKNLRSPFNFLMTNLSLADLIVGTIVCPLSIHFHLMEAQRETISIIQIRVFHLSYFIASTASVLSLASLAVERYAAIRWAFQQYYYLSHQTGNATKVPVHALQLINQSTTTLLFSIEAYT